MGAAVLAAMCLCACGVTTTPLEAATGDATSATGAAALALRGLDDGDLTTTVAETTIKDAVTTVSSAAKQAAAYEPRNARERRLQGRAVDAIADAVHDLHRAREVVSKPGQRERLAALLSKDRDRLEKLSTRAGSVG